MPNFKQAKHQKGITLIELMIALALGVIVIAGVVSGMAALSRSSHSQINHNNLQTTGNTALDYITFQLRNALASPCERFSDTDNINNLVITLPTVKKGKYTSINNADDLERLIRHLGIQVKSTNVKVDGKTLTTDNITFVGTGNQLFDSNPSKKIKKNHYYVASNCQKIKIIRGTTLIENLQDQDFDLRLIAPLTASVISIHKNNDKGRKRNTLYSRSLFGRAERLMDNIELMRVFFGIDTYRYDEFSNQYSSGQDGVVDTFKTPKEIANDVATGSDNYHIISAEVYVLVRADKPDYSSPKSYTLYLPNTDSRIDKINENSQITFTDNVPRKVFSRSVNLRNTAKTW